MGAPLDHLLHRRVLGVEHAQRVRVQAAARVLVEQLLVLLQVGDQGLAVRGALGRLAQAVEFEADVLVLLQPQALPELADEQDELGVDIRAGQPQALDIELVELPVAALCGRSWRNTAPMDQTRSGPL